MRLHRPYIPYSVRAAVARRMLIERGFLHIASSFDACEIPDSRKLRAMLYHLFGDERVHLDHDPPLMLRTIRGTGFTPDANDPQYLIYRTTEDHRLKTFVRGDGARRSDMAQRRYLKRIAERKDSKRKKFKWPKRKLRGGKNVDTRNGNKSQRHAARIPD